MQRNEGWLRAANASRLLRTRAGIAPVARRDHQGQNRAIGGTGEAAHARLRELAEASADGAHKEFQLERVKQLETGRRQAALLLPALKTLLSSPRR